MLLQNIPVYIKPNPPDPNAFPIFQDFFLKSTKTSPSGRGLHSLCWFFGALPLRLAGILLSQIINSESKWVLLSKNQTSIDNKKLSQE